MWILESDGEFLQGKRVWLRPGQRYLFGRVKKQGIFQAIDHKSVSRRQFVIEVSKVNDGDGSRLHTRSGITIIDEKSKSGTLVDDEHLKGTSKKLKKTEHVLKLGQYPHALVIKWHPICLSFSLTAKEKKSSDAIASKRSLLEPFDIKVIQTFVTDQTTYVVATKRNTVSGLQALISGKHIIDSAYIDSLIFATTPEDLEGEENLTPLEKDFDGGWPDPTRHLPPSGKEPTAKPAEAYSPDPTREAVFEGWTFVFLDSGQYDTVLPAITTGQGKALLFNLEPKKTTADELVSYMQNCAGEKDFGSFAQSTDSGGVVMVRPTLKSNVAAWGEELINQVAIKLNQKYIDQADFLDAILGNDASSLRRSVPYESFAETTAPAPVAITSSRIPSKRGHSEPNESELHVENETNGDTSPPQSKAEPERESPPRKRPRTRAAPVTRFKAFADAFNMDDVPAYDPVDEEVESQSLLLQGGDTTPKSPEDEGTQANGDGDRGSKRARSPEEIDMMEGLLPAAAAMKRRKLEHAQKQGNPANGSINGAAERTTKTVKPKKEIDVRKAARERREAEEAAAKRDQEALDENHGDMTIEEMKKLAVIEVMDLPAREAPQRPTNGESHDRWDERWNGRKNFKRFRRHGEPTTNIRRLGQNVIVPLVEVAQKSYGIGESYWSSSRNQEDDSSRRNGRREATSQTQTQPETEEATATTQTQSATQESTSPTTTRLQREAAAIVGAIDIDRPRKTRLTDKTQRSQQTMNSSRSKQPSGSSGGPAPKKQKTIRTKAVSESDSDEGLRFKFGGRKR